MAFCEIEEFPRKVLAKHWPDVPIYEDVRGLRHGGTIDLICGGYPCQPFSTASRGRHVAEDLWYAMYDVIQRHMPRYIITENVAKKPQERALNDLRSIGYSGFLKRISADDAGADHKRNRWWVCAYADNESQLYSAVNAKMAKLQEVCSGVWGPENYARAIRVPDWLPNRMDRFKVLGNTVLPYIPQEFGNAILESDMQAPLDDNI